MSLIQLVTFSLPQYSFKYSLEPITAPKCSCRPSARLITLTSTLIIPDITKTLSSNCLLHSWKFFSTARVDIGYYEVTLTMKLFPAKISWVLNTSKGGIYDTAYTKEGADQCVWKLVIAHVRWIKILTWLRGYLVIFLYLVWFSLCSILFWELRDNGVVINLHFFLIYRTWAIGLTVFQSSFLIFFMFGILLGRHICNVFVSHMNLWYKTKWTKPRRDTAHLLPMIITPKKSVKTQPLRAHLTKL